MTLKRQVNIIITGTPGTGKSSHAQLLIEQDSGLKLVDVNELAKANNLYAGFDKERNSQIVDDEKLLDFLEDDLEKGNNIIDWHCCDVFPERLIDLVIVLRSDNTILYDRLKARDYEGKKIEENIDAEIMEVILNDARESFDEEIIVPLESNKIEEVQSNVDRILDWIKQWRERNPEGIQNVTLDSSSDSDSD
ncbi:Adenylate kinase isoenzyme 6 FAP7 [Wickerhamiella sorbophila]|uniref:Adenylate kinase isoenzyme 6 homolog n=1 Tax=Wickerhamiella sorbophila TaxID=45607 RepID=A0A2T0FBV6_9ASCO|nr:Adenylate kinase isoenzyme 6 FAP7 [Wickerhamiella sorbophila]PRT52493.1 Adenylate kinase isoenzyme 6 FAP7 [Wickerhamiella sorbophila]